MKNILYICSRNFFNPNSGHETKMYYNSKGLHEKFGYNVDLYIFDDNKNINKPSFINNVYYASKISILTIIKNILIHSLFNKNKWPLQTDLYYSKKNLNNLKKIINNCQYDAVIIDMIRLAEYQKVLNNSKCNTILDLDDLLSKRYQNELMKMDKKTSLVGIYGNKMNTLSKIIVNLSFIKKFILKYETSILTKYESQQYQIFDHLILVSKKEAQEFNQLNKQNKAIAVGIGTDYSYFSKNLKINKEENTACFVGNMKYPPNIDSVRYIVNNVLPLCQNNIVFKIIGSYDNKLKNELASDNVIFLGRVEDLRKAVKENMVFFAPIAYGTGIKTKILEALAMGMPIITNSVGAESIEVKDGYHLLIKDDEKQLAKCLDELMNKSDLKTKLSKNAQEFARLNLDWDIIYQNFKKIGL